MLKTETRKLGGEVGITRELLEIVDNSLAEKDSASGQHKNCNRTQSQVGVSKFAASEIGRERNTRCHQNQASSHGFAGIQGRNQEARFTRVSIPAPRPSEMPVGHFPELLSGRVRKPLLTEMSRLFRHCNQGLLRPADCSVAFFVSTAQEGQGPVGSPMDTGIVFTPVLPAVILPGPVLRRQWRWTKFQNYSFLIATGFRVSHLAYRWVLARAFAVPAKAFRTGKVGWAVVVSSFTIAARCLQNRPPSNGYRGGQIQLTRQAVRGTGWISKPVFRIYFAYTLSIIFATVYLRYHYTVDVLAGIARALVLICVSPWVYRNLQERN
ncbi:MAG TPA: hypothetical protein VML19_01235 [Verrucomicrobiae bacterium]|nr:hypothetical protein [Verrucomicrobiae bacterium]